MISNSIKKRREKAGLSQKVLALQLHVGQPAVAMWETGRSVPRVSKLTQLAEILHCSVDDLLVNDGLKY